MASFSDKKWIVLDGFVASNGERKKLCVCMIFTRFGLCYCNYYV